MKKQQRNILIAVAVLLLLYFWWESTQTTTRVSNGNGNGNKHCTNMCCSGKGDIVSPSTYPECKCPTTDYIFSNNECVARGVIGCMDATASNFNASATINAPNSCNYIASPAIPPIVTPPIVTPPNIPQHCTNMCCSHLGNIVSPSAYPECKCPTTDYIFSNNGCVARGVIGCMDATASNFNASATINAPNTCLYGQQSHDCYSNCSTHGGNFTTLNTTDTCGTGNATAYPNISPPTCVPSVQSHFCYTNCGGRTGTNFSSMATNLPCGVGLTADYPNSSAPNCAVIMS